MSSYTHTRRERWFGHRKIRCLLASDHVLLRQGLRRLLEDERDVEVVAETGEAGETLETLLELCPEVVVTDVNVFGLAPDQAERLILRASPRSKVLFLPSNEGCEMLPASGAGKAGWAAERQTSARELLETIRSAHVPERAPVPEMPRLDSRGRPGEGTSRAASLTAREREVLELLAEGKTVRSVAKILTLSLKTVDTHKFNLMRKLGVHNKAELVRWAIQEKYLRLPANF